MLKLQPYKGLYSKGLKSKTIFLSDSELEETAERDHEVCLMLDWVFITLADSTWAATTGNLRMWIRQGSIECSTDEGTWKKPEGRKKTLWERAKGCHNTFDYTKPVDVWLGSNSENAVIVGKMGVGFDVDGKYDKSKDKTWNAPNDYKEIEKGYQNGWYTTES